MFTHHRQQCCCNLVQMDGMLAFNYASSEESAQERGVITDGKWQEREPLCFRATIFEWTQSVHLPVYPYKVIRWGCVGSNTVTVTRRADYCTSLTPFWVVRYASPPLPAAIPLPRLPVPALECFCSILNRLIEQCSRERAACQSQLKTQKQKIKKAHGWTPALIKKF